MTEIYKSKVLVVDDISSNIEFVTDVLEAENITVLSALNGETALQIANSENIDLILLDISMPQMDGYEVCYRLKATEATKDIPVIFLTARVQKEDIVKGFEVGAVDYVVKPFSFNELISRVKTHIELIRKTKQLQSINDDLEDLVQKRTQLLIKANDDLTIANTQLSKANNELKTLDEAKNQFIAHINHELRTPLNGILGYVSLLEDLIEDPTYTEYLLSIGTLTNRLIKLSELSLLYTELSTFKDNITLQRTKLSDCIDRALDCKEASEKNLSYEVNNIYDDIFVMAEPKLLTSCFTIIVDNAVKYSPPNSAIKIDVVKSENNSVEISISDKGPGFTDKARAQLFELFSADNLKHRSYGFGIGLATANNILNLFDGSISIDEKLISGAMVTLTLKYI